MVNFTILAGGFSTFIATYVFDSDANTLSLTKQSETGSSPSWIASHPTNLSILYAVNELNPGGFLQSFTVDSAGGVQNVDNVTTGGNGPTFTVMLSTGEVTGMNFGSPNCSFVATVPDDPLHFERDSPVISFPIPEGAPSNPHMSLEVGDEVFVPDLGGDKIWRIARNGAPGNFKVQGQIDVDKGTGPRHIAVRDNILFTVHETASTLTAQAIPAGPNGTALPLIANVSTFPADALPGSKFAAAEILISTPTDKFPTPLIYVSNRNISPNVTDPAGDTIAIFEFVNGTDCTEASAGSVRRMLRRRLSRRQDDANATAGAGGQLKLLAQIPTGLQQIRSMALGRVDDGGDEFLIAGANTVGGVAVFQRVDGGRNLTLSVRNTDLENRTSFVFVEGA
ncbi:Lactonase, 7-bladed beta-propeller-domain-containing protein [Mycena albidolilacea]|uniref:Lactonase, 7-bladed beta-propeller-domain-containing protein n=1 Tax=Mycena albidolilacea TaxID=1033008 RepID=A0AAD6ZE92_9AGAR|nr:Lactonase, 7-bladed beta-propeller-domain-containing protein [Mycena albidolilacea]